MDKSKKSQKPRGFVPRSDRAQRIVAGTALMVLTLLGIDEGTSWRTWAALTIQSELLLTGLAGWCPVYWSCSVAAAPRANAKHDLDER